MSLLAGSCVGSGFGAGILEAGNSTVLDTNASGSSSPSLWKRSFGSAAAAAAVSSTVQGLANSRAKRFEEFNAAGTVAATRWISVRRTLQDALYAVSEALVAIARTADITHGAADDISRTAGDDAHAGSILCVPFGKCVAVYSRNVLMLDLGALSDCRDIASALVTDTPLHIAMQELYQLAESIPVSLLPPSASTAAVSVEENQQNPLMLLISTIFDVVKLHSDLKPDPYPAGLDAATCALAQLLEDITLKGIQAAKDGAMFYMKNILKAPLNSYLLVTEDPAWSAQPIITMKVLGDGKQGQQRKKPPPAPSPFRQMMIEYLRSFRPESNLQASLVFLQREYSLHMMSAKLLVCSRHALSNEDPLLRQAPAQHALLRSMFEKTLLGSALANMLLFGLRFMGTAGQNAVDACLPPKVSSDNLLFMVSQLAEIFRSKPDASAASNALAGQNSSELLSVFGCSFKAYHDMLNLLIHRQQYAIEHPASGSLTTGTVAPKQPLTSSEMSRRLELEIFQLRHCLQGLLRSGQWEVGIEVAQLYLEKYKVVSSLPFVPPPPPPPLPQQVANPLLRSSPPPMPMPMSPTRNLIPIGTAAKPQTGTPQRAPFSPQGQHQLLQHFTFEDTKLSPLPQPPVTPSSAPSPAPTHTPILNPTASIAKRIDAMKAELVRVLDTLDSRVKSNGDLRLFSHFYALRFVSDTPWEASTQDETLQRALGHIREEGFQCTSAWMHVSAGASEEPGIATVAPVQSTASSVYEYWLLMKFDASSFPVCADFYDDILALDEQRVQDAKKGIHGGGRGGSGFSLVSPIAYHNIQAQVRKNVILPILLHTVYYIALIQHIYFHPVTANDGVPRVHDGVLAPHDGELLQREHLRRRAPRIHQVHAAVPRLPRRYLRGGAPARGAGCAAGHPGRQG